MLPLAPLALIPRLLRGARRDGRRRSPTRSHICARMAPLFGLLFAVDWLFIGPAFAVLITLRLALLATAFTLVVATTSADEIRLARRAPGALAAPGLRVRHRPHLGPAAAVGMARHPRSAARAGAVPRRRPAPLARATDGDGGPGRSGHRPGDAARLVGARGRRVARHRRHRFHEAVGGGGSRRWTRPCSVPPSAC